MKNIKTKFSLNCCASTPCLFDGYLTALINYFYPAIGFNDCVLVAIESGRKPRPMKEEWVTDIKDQCQTAGIAFFFKQWGGTNKKKTGRILEGKTWDAMPEIIESL